MQEGCAAKQGEVAPHAGRRTEERAAGMAAACEAIEGWNLHHVLLDVADDIIFSFFTADCFLRRIRFLNVRGISHSQVSRVGSVTSTVKVETRVNNQFMLSRVRIQVVSLVTHPLEVAISNVWSKLM